MGHRLDQDLPVTENETVTIAAEEEGQRLDRVLAARIPSLSRSRLKALILAGQVTVEAGAEAPARRTIRDPSMQVKSGEVVMVTLPPPEEAQPKGEDIPLTIVYEDDALIVIDKPSGLVVHPAAGHATGTLVNALIAHCGDSLSGIGGVKRPGIVHRLDKDTTGLMVVAKNDRAHRSLSAQFADHGRTNQMRRGYLAFVWGAPDRPRGTIDAPLDRHPHNRERRAVREFGREAVTHWELLETYPGHDGKPVASLVACTLETGRTHQIRVHLAHIGHPIMGDETYGTGFKTKISRLGPEAQAALGALGRQALHAYLLAIEHPDSDTADVLEFRSELPGDLRRLRDALAAENRVPGPKRSK
ncbi:MAG: RluA family pseudouridine synthase [Pseudolabrys sp.]|nr:RluA family pseudouridine synthase [Pseudolabrys sp.]